MVNKFYLELVVMPQGSDLAAKQPDFNNVDVTAAGRGLWLVKVMFGIYIFYNNTDSFLRNAKLIS